MSAARHTPGPWIVGNGGDILTADEKHVIAYDEGRLGSGTEEEQANARLIAAAPDLLAELKDAMNMLQRLAVEKGNLNPDATVMVAKRELIARTEGRAA